MVNIVGRIFWALFFYLELHHLGNDYMDAEERTDQLVVVGILENYLQFFFIQIVIWMNGSTITTLQLMSIMSSIGTVSRTLG
jgi:hypothetical protein